MIAYLDASVVLRVLLEQENPLAEWELLQEGACFATHDNQLAAAARAMQFEVIGA